MEGKTNALITMISCQTDGESQDKTEVVYPGKVYEKDGCFYVFYEEVDGDDGQVTKASLRLRPHYVDIRKNGGTEARMVFIPGESTESEYRTSYGTIFLRVDTRRADVFRERDQIKVELDYLLSFGGAQSVTNQLTIKVERLVP